MPRIQFHIVAGLVAALLLGAWALPVSAEDAPPTAEQLKESLKNSDFNVRRDAARAIRNMNRQAQREWLATMAEALAKDSDPQVKLAALDILTDLGEASAESVPMLAEGVKSSFGVRGPESQHYRYRAAVALAGVGKPAVESLQKLLADSNGSVRGLAAMALGKIGPASEPAVPTLVGLLRDSSEPIRAEATQALGRIGPAAADALIEAAGDSSAQVRGCAVTALGAIDRPSDKIRAAVLAHTGDEDLAVRAAAIAATSRLGIAPETLAPIFETALKDADERVRRAAVNAAVDDRRLIAELGRALPDMLLAESDDVSRNAAFLLRSSGPQAAPTLLAALRDERARIEQIADALSATGTTVNAALFTGLGDSSPRVRSGAALALGRVRPIESHAVEKLIAVLGDPEPAVQVTAIESLGNLGPVAIAAAEPLRARVPAGPLAVRVAAIGALFEIGPRDESLAQFVAGQVGDAEPAVRERAIVALWRMGRAARGVVAAVAERVSDPELKVRLAATRYLGSQGRSSAAAVSDLRGLLADPDVELRAAVIETLGRIGAPAKGALTELTALINDPSPLVRAEVARSLTGLDLEAIDMQPLIGKALRDDDFTVRFAAMESIRAFRKDGAILFAPDLLVLIGSQKDSQRLGETNGRFQGRPPDPRSIPTLVELLSYPKDAVRLAAIDMLAKSGEAGQPAIEALEKLSEDPSSAVRDAAKGAIEGIKTGKAPAPRGGRRRGG